MRHARRLLTLAAGTGALFAIATRADAGPTVIGDEMLRDTRVTPVLGRGYSMATNTFQGSCLASVTRTTPSYNFDFRFEDLESKKDVTGAKGFSTHNKLSPGSGAQAWLDRIGGSVDATFDYTDKVTREHWYRHSVLVTIGVDVYYSSVDEANSKLSAAATSLLASGDVPGFFDACGIYYVRSISRQSSLFAIYTYENKEQDRDIDLEIKLEASIRNFYVDVESKNSVFNKTTTKLSDTKITIHTLGFGLGKQAGGDSLVSYDLDGFKKAIAAALKSTQADDVGMVTAIEVVPWVENPEFQQALALKPLQVEETDDLGRVIKDSNGKPKMKTVLPYAQKRTLTTNSEFLAEIDRAARAKLNVYYKAKQCREKIEHDYMELDDAGNVKFLPGRDQVLLVDNRETATMGQDAQTVSVGKLYGDWLSTQRMSLLFSEYDAFVYGGKEAATGGGADQSDDDLERGIEEADASGKYPKDLFPGAMTCVDRLLEAGLTARPYGTIPACHRIEMEMTAVSGRVVDDYCMPTESTSATTATQRNEP